MYVNGSSVGLNWRVGVDFVVCANIDRFVKSVFSWDSVIQNINKYIYIYIFVNALCIYKLTERDLTNIRIRSCTNFLNIQIGILNLIIVKYSTATWVCNSISSVFSDRWIRYKWFINSLREREMYKCCNNEFQ